MPAVLAHKLDDQRWGYFVSAPSLNPEFDTAVITAVKDAAPPPAKTHARTFLGQRGGESWQSMLAARKKEAHLARLDELARARMGLVQAAFAARLIQK